jgi:hypothetical protein
MKKLIGSAIAVCIAFSGLHAQSTKLVVKATTGVDTVYFMNMPSKVKSLQYTFTKTSGTVSGKVILEGSIDGTYVGVDSFTLADVAYPQSKKTSITSTDFLHYRYRVTTATPGTVRTAYLRRTDE